MAGEFGDHPGKRVIREQWNTPVLKTLFERWGKQYFYFGLPGPKATDIFLWKEMIRRIVAFELVRYRYSDPKRNILELRKNLAKLGIDNTVYCGSMEETVLYRQDYETVEFDLDDSVTLFNLDFTNHISSKVLTRDGNKALRFEALRELMTYQRDLFRETDVDKFILFMTVYKSVDTKIIQQFVSIDDLPHAIKQFLTSSNPELNIGDSKYCTSEKLINAFIFFTLREYMHGSGIESYFFPPVSYIGTTPKSPMIHFTILCKMIAECEPVVRDHQTFRELLTMPILTANDERIINAEPLSYLSECQWL